MSNATALISSSVPIFTTCAPGAGWWVNGGSPARDRQEATASAIESPAAATAGAWRRMGRLRSAPGSRA
jgi:hypothetical protein